MIKEVTMYTVICDNCLSDSNEGGEYSCWFEKEGAEYSAEESGYVKRDGKHYCDSCIVFNDDDEEIINPDRTKTILPKSGNR